MDRKLISELMHASRGEAVLEYMLDEFREIIKSDIVMPDILYTPAMDKKFEEMYAKAKELDDMLTSIMHDMYWARKQIEKKLEEAK